MVNFWRQKKNPALSVGNNDFTIMRNAAMSHISALFFYNGVLFCIRMKFLFKFQLPQGWHAMKCMLIHRCRWRIRFGSLIIPLHMFGRPKADQFNKRKSKIRNHFHWNIQWLAIPCHLKWSCELSIILCLCWSWISLQNGAIKKNPRIFFFFKREKKIN